MSLGTALSIFMSKRHKKVLVPIPKKYIDKKEQVEYSTYVPVKLPENVKVIFTANPKHTDFPKTFFYKWEESCKQIPADRWPLGRKKVSKKYVEALHQNSQCALHSYVGTDQGFPDCRGELQTIAIADMHAMQLVNTIKWCIRLAKKEIAKEGFQLMTITAAQLLAPVPQWKTLLEEGLKRELSITGGKGFENYWVQECLAAIIWDKLEV